MSPEATQSNIAADSKSFTVVMTGGGSGGHITPILAVARSLKETRPDAQVVYIGERGGRLGDIAAAHETIDVSYLIFAGKLRRYHGEGLKQLLDISTMLKNLRDIFYVTMGFWQALYRLQRIKPAVIFVKGGFVGVPVGLAAACLRIPYITHDSDSIPGLANRILARWATAHAVAMAKELYPYPADKTYEVGVPLETHFTPVTPELKQQYRGELQIAKAEQVIFVTGGGLGAVRLNEAIAAAAGTLLNEFPRLYLLHAAGRGQDGVVRAAYDRLPLALRERIVVRDFVRDLYRYSGAADVIVARGGASALAEFAAQGKACIVVPNPFLTGGHQLKNAEHLQASGAIVVVTEDELKKDQSVLGRELSSLLKDHARQAELGSQLSQLARPDAAKRLTELLLQNVKL